jgi:prepilin-type N-terminal cleavage/methylation domain-containing protein
MEFGEIMKKIPNTHTKGFTLIEILVALALLGILGVVASGFLLPLRINRDSSQESQALTYARSYVEVLKARWLDRNTFENKNASGVALVPITYGVPVVGTTGAIDIKIPSNEWKIETNSTTWAPGDNLRTVEVKVTTPNSKIYKVITMVTRP